MSHQELAKVPALTFYKDAYTSARRTSPLPQLVCTGKPCKQYTPEVIRCVNLGGIGTDIDWKCEADLPESLRFGRVEVACEGFSKPGDTNILKGSCSLDYHLVKVPDSLTGSSWFSMANLFMFIWVGFLLFILFAIFRSCWASRPSNDRTRTPRDSNPDPNTGDGWVPGGYHDPYDHPPPPYRKDPPSGSWRPGFWSGAALGGLAMRSFANRDRDDEPTATVETVRGWGSPWDWEQANLRRQLLFGGNRARSRSDDRGEGPSNLGSMRRGTGLGGTSIR